MDTDLDRLAAEGYLPIDIDIDAAAVVLARLARADFREVWYADTAATAARGRVVVVPVRAFLEQFGNRRSDGLRLIAHTSRCGSTLLANLLALRPATMVMKEPDFVTVPARTIALATDVATARRSESLLRAMTNYSSRAADACGRRLVIKLTSWTVPIVRACLETSDSTWLFLWREPEKVVASNIATPSTWGRDTTNGLAARRLAGVADAVTDAVLFYATTWQLTVDSFLAADANLAWRAVEYRDLVTEKAVSLLAAERWFGFSPDTGLPDGFDQESRRYSKGQPADTFEPTTTHRRGPLTPAAVTEVEAVTRHALQTLRGAQEHRLF